MKMRRSDREITDADRITEIIEECKIMRIGFNDNGEVYIVPLNYGHEETDGKHYFYFHGAKAGRKYNLVKNAKDTLDVGFEMDSGYALLPAETACDYSAAYRSIIGKGKISLVHGNEAKRYGLELIMKEATGIEDWNFPVPMLLAVAVFCLEVTELTCKERKIGK